MQKPMSIDDLPPGVVFEPSDQELLTNYLFPKIRGEDLPCEIIQEKQVYSDNPWNVFQEISASGMAKETMYVFTKLKKKAAAPALLKNRKPKIKEGIYSKEQFVREAGCGSWAGQTGPKKIVDDSTDEILGFKKMLVFRITDASGLSPEEINSSGYWIMHEYSFSGNNSGYVVCEITRDGSKNTKIKPNFKVPRNGRIKINAANPSTSTATTSTADDDEIGRGQLVVADADDDFKKLELDSYQRTESEIEILYANAMLLQEGEDNQQMWEMRSTSRSTQAALVQAVYNYDRLGNTTINNDNVGRYEGGECLSSIEGEAAGHHLLEEEEEEEEEILKYDEADHYLEVDEFLNINWDSAYDGDLGVESNYSHNLPAELGFEGQESITTPLICWGKGNMKLQVQQ